MSGRFRRLPTPAKILLLMLLALFPLGLAISATSYFGLREARSAADQAVAAQANSGGRAIEGLLARNTLALRLAANAAAQSTAPDRCAAANATLSVAPAVSRDFSMADASGKPLCDLGSADRFSELRSHQPFAAENHPAAPGDVALWISPDQRSIVLGVGVENGSAIEEVGFDELRDVAVRAAPMLRPLSLSDGRRTIDFITGTGVAADGKQVIERHIGSGRLTLKLVSDKPQISPAQEAVILLPLLMWLAAALLGWLQANRLLVRPLRRLEKSVGAYQPGAGTHFVLPDNLGPAREIHELGDSFVRAVDRIEQGERAMAEALEGQRRLVREVHHRVKNNLQVIASLLSIHGRNAVGADARDAYAAIARRVDALSVVHRNHYAELEDQRGIALRPLFTELGAGLRASAPETARRMSIEIDADSLHTTQDAAVAAAFFITEIAEFAMLKRPDDPVEIVLRRRGDLEARLSVGSSVLHPPEGDSGGAEQVQFDRILEALARQLRSPLERKLGRYSVMLPVFPVK